MRVTTGYFFESYEFSETFLSLDRSGFTRILKKLLFWLQMRIWVDFCNRGYEFTCSLFLCSVNFG